MSKCDKDCVRTGEPHQECAEHGEVACLRREVGALTMQRAMTVHRLGGMVEGMPTHAGNFLQRIDALRAIERAALALMSRNDFWISAATLMALPGEIDNLADVLAESASGGGAAPATKEVPVCKCGHDAGSHDYCVGYCRARRPSGSCGCKHFTKDAPSASGGDEARCPKCGGPSSGEPCPKCWGTGKGGAR